jgi:hypothetical protein
MKAPLVAGGYRSNWVMATDKRSNFKEELFLKIVVIGLPTATPTVPPPPPTPTPTQ